MKVRYLVKYTKENEIKFISHLDLMRTIQRTIRRAELKVEYSKGFNPHMTLSIAQPLSVGVYSYGEYFDVYLLEEMDEKDIKNKLNDSAPNGIKILDVKKVVPKDDKKIPPSMALIESASYSIKIPYKDTTGLNEELDELLKQKEWNMVKKTKKGKKEVDIKSMIKKIDFNIEREYLGIKTLVLCGSKGNLSAQLLADFIKNNTSNAHMERFVKIEREELYTYKNKKLVSLLEYFS
ncbi:TIGR03936 family radical SAM-associated protein [Haloimpatiens sp. FM7330]|uniref:TIGR03936 family radical SAM-associated protein n=1 Tax=Haloimpatiens sp. FM7330 TaxID=3298610 RepID=UPI00363E6EEB